MECIVLKEFNTNGISVKLSSAFTGDHFHFFCYDKFEESNPFPRAGFDKEQVEALRDWLNKIIYNYDHTSNLCQNCFKVLPITAELNGLGFWIQTCEHCAHQHEIARNV